MRFFLILFVLHCLSGAALAAQVCITDSIQASTPDSELKDNGDETITDLRTGLMWKQCLEGYSGTGCTTAATTVTFTWRDALDQPAVNNIAPGFANYTDWRLPNIKELATIVEMQCYAPAANSNRFPNLPDYTNVWSGSPSFNVSSSWSLAFRTGKVLEASRNDSDYVRLVRTANP
jgi:hypothetical protein